MRRINEKSTATLNRPQDFLLFEWLETEAQRESDLQGIYHLRIRGAPMQFRSFRRVRGDQRRRNVHVSR